MSDAVFCPATEFTLDELRLAMNAAFVDYAIPMRLSEEAFERMMIQRGLELSVSRVAVVDGRAVAFWFMSVRDSRAYLISSGTIPECRGKGLSGALASEVLTALRAGGVLSFQTEVMEGNLNAQRLYHRIGLKTYRALGCCELREPVKCGTITEPIKRCSWSDLSGRVTEFRDWHPAWQNSEHSIMAVEDDVACLVAHRNGEPAGFLALFHRTNTVAQIAVHKSWRRQGIGTALIRSAFAISEATVLRLINYENEDRSFTRFLDANHCLPTEGQMELRMNLSR